MTSHFKYIFTMLIVFSLALTACNLPVAASPTASPPTVSPPVLATLTISPLPATATFTPVVTIGPTFTVEPSLTPTQAIPMAEVQKESNCRKGPAENYERVATYAVGQKLEVVANDLGAGFLYGRNPDKPEETCWILAANLAVSGEVASLPQFTPPPSPLPAPAFSAVYKKIYQCKTDMFFMFIIENTGGANFRSAYIKATDVKSGKSTEQALNAFDLRSECVIAKNITPLTPGSTGYLYTLPFKSDMRGRTLKIIIMVCTEQNLKGVCATQVLEIKPK